MYTVLPRSYATLYTATLGYRQDLERISPHVNPLFITHPAIWLSRTVFRSQSAISLSIMPSKYSKMRDQRCTCK